MSNLRVKAAAFYLVHIPNENKTHAEQLEILENASLAGEGDNMAAYIEGLTVWEYFDHETVDGLLERIDDLEKEYRKVWNEALMLGFRNGSGVDNTKIKEPNKTYYLFGNQSVRTYENEDFEGLKNFVKEGGEFGVFEFIESETEAGELLAAFDGWDGYTTITQKEYNQLNDLQS